MRKGYQRAAVVAMIVALGALGAAPVQASPLSWVAKAGRLAAKGGAGAKARLAAKGGRLAGAGIAAEQVLRHIPAHPKRLAVFIGRSDEGVAAVLRGAEAGGGSAAVGGASVRRFLADLDEMAKATPSGGVDVVVDPEVLAELGGLPGHARTRLWIARADGPPVPVESVAHTPEPVARLGPRVVTQLLGEAPRLASLADLEVQLKSAALNPPDELSCAAELAAAAEGSGLRTSEQGPYSQGEGVLVLAAGPDTEAWAWAEAGGIHRVELILDAPCARDAHGNLRGAAMIRELAAARDWGEVWALGPGAEPEEMGDPTSLEARLVESLLVGEEAVEVVVRGEGALLRAGISLRSPERVGEPPSLGERIMSALCCGPAFVLLLLWWFVPGRVWRWLRGAGPDA